MLAHWVTSGVGSVRRVYVDSSGTPFAATGSKKPRYVHIQLQYFVSHWQLPVFCSCQDLAGDREKLTDHAYSSEWVAAREWYLPFKLALPWRRLVCCVLPPRRPAVRALALQKSLDKSGPTSRQMRRAKPPRRTPGKCLCTTEKVTASVPAGSDASPPPA